MLDVPLAADAAAAAARGSGFRGGAGGELRAAGQAADPEQGEAEEGGQQDLEGDVRLGQPLQELRLVTRPITSSCALIVNRVLRLGRKFTFAAKLMIVCSLTVKWHRLITAILDIRQKLILKRILNQYFNYPLDNQLLCAFCEHGGHEFTV